MERAQLFAFVPFLDEIDPEVEILDGAFETVAAAGNVALGIESVISDPASAPMVFLDLIAGGKLRGDEDFAKAAKARRALTAADLKSIGKDFKAEQDKFDALTKINCLVLHASARKATKPTYKLLGASTK